MNNVQLLGRLTRDPEFNQEYENAKFTLAVDRNLSSEKKREMKQKKQQTADFISCVCWGRLAEFAEKYTAKGCRVLVNGQITTSTKTSKDGRINYYTQVTVRNLEPIDWPNRGSFKPAEEPTDGDFTEASDDRLPF